ncbi:MAG TPA: MotA/TolQ/ExbB proton channel family protein [Haliangiales bacterium]|nr:MotA/TolQ/ExbB proton channel family protein [Haliangiales bacterium]
MDITGRFLAFTLLGSTWVLWLLIGLSVLSFAVIIERLWYFATHRVDPGTLAADMRDVLALGSEAPNADAPNADAIDAALVGAKARERQRLERRLAYLGTLGANAPFVGLFGTVLGIIKAFHDLAGSQAGGVSVVMAGISEALVSTAAGLLVAIPAVVAFNYFNRRVRSRMGQVEWMAHLALERIKAPLLREVA